MRQVWITKAGAPKVLQVREASDPTPKPGELRIRVRASGINFADLMARVGLYPDAPKLPCVVGYEVSGVVDALGEQTTGFSIGDRVLAMCHFGGYSDVVTLPSSQALKMPERMSFEQGAAFPVVYLTAYNTMLFTGHLRRGSSVLILSAAGGVAWRRFRSPRRESARSSAARPFPSTHFYASRAANTCSTRLEILPSKRAPSSAIAGST